MRNPSESSGFVLFVRGWKGAGSATRRGKNFVLGERRSARAVAQQPTGSGGSNLKRFFEEKKDKTKTPSSGDCVNRLAHLLAHFAL